MPLLSISATGRFGPYRAFLAGELTWDQIKLLSDYYGIYQNIRIAGKAVLVQKKFYRPTNPRTIGQQVRRAIFTAGVVHWQGLSLEEKKVYNERASRLRFSGFNLHQREWLNS